MTLLLGIDLDGTIGVGYLGVVISSMYGPQISQRALLTPERRLRPLGCTALH